MGKFSFRVGARLILANDMATYIGTYVRVCMTRNSLQTCTYILHVGFREARFDVTFY